MAGSSAGYRVNGVLNGADVTVDITDNGLRDGYFRDDVMEVDTYPTATFLVPGPVELRQLTGSPVTVPVTGELTVRGTARQVQAGLSVVRTSEGVDVSGSVPLVFADHGVEAPNLGFVPVADRGAVAFLLRLGR